MQCPRCRAENRNEARFCRECGATFSRACPSCGAKVEAGSRFCDGCGAPLAAASSPATRLSHLASPESYTPKHLAEKILTSAAEGPRTLELAGEIADGVIVNVGLEPTLVKDAVAHVHAGARRAGRDPASIDLWTMVRANVTDELAAGIDEIRMELASHVHHVFRFTLDGKHVPPALADVILRVQKGYQPAAHDALGPSPHAALLDAEPALRAYLAERFAAVGAPPVVADKLRAVVDAGITGLLVTGFVHERQALIRTLGERVLSRLA